MHTPTTPPPLPPQPHTAPAATFAAPPRKELVQDNHPCLKCGYNLRGLSVGAVCPECGTTIGESLRTYLLAYAPREYVKLIHTGLTIVFIATLFFLISSFAPIVLAFVPSLFARVLGGPFGMLNVTGWIALVQMAPILLALVGYWLATPADPGLSNFSRVQTPRLLTRTAIITLATCGVLLLIVQFIVPRALAPALTALTAPAAATGTTPPGTTPPAPAGPSPVAVLNLFRALPLGWIIVGVFASVFQSIAWLVLFFGFVSYIRLLAPRLPDQQLTTLATTWLWLLPVIYIFGMCFMIGPIVAMALYLMLLWMFRTKLGTLALATQTD